VFHVLRRTTYMNSRAQINSRAASDNYMTFSYFNIWGKVFRVRYFHIRHVFWPISCYPTKL